jgi:hypothetical protein
MKRAFGLRGWLCAGSLVWACSVQVPDEEELFAGGGRGGTGGSSGTAGTGGASGSSGSAGLDASGDGAAGDGALAEGGDAADAAGPFDPSVGLLIHYKFDETNGDIVHDQNSTDNNARILNMPAATPWVATGKVGGALQLPGGLLTDGGATPAYVELPRNVFTNLQATTVATWFRWEGGAAPQHVFDLGSGLPSWIYFSPLFETGPRVAARKAGGDNFFDVVITRNVTVSTWTHVAITWNADRIDVYLDGIRAGGLAPPRAPATGEVIIPSDLGNTARNWIGRSQFSETYNDPFFSGMVDEFRIYDRALPAAHVAALKQLGE